MEVTENVRTLCTPVVDELGIELYDVERAGGILRVTVDRPGGVSLDQVAEATRRISRILDEHDPVPGRYTLEVTSPGLERNLRTPEHFRRAVGMTASLRVRGADGAQRVRGTIVSTDDDGVTLAPADGGPTTQVAFSTIDRARTVFEWGGAERPAGSRRTKKKPASARRPAGSSGDSGADHGDDGDDGDDNEVSRS